MTLEELTALLTDDVAAALDLPPTPMRAALDSLTEEAFRLAYGDERPGETAPMEDVAAFSASFSEPWERTIPSEDEGQPERIARIIAHGAINAAVMAAAGPGASVTWITMQDDAVREMHVPMHGVTVAAGEPFNVGGFPLLYPGQPIGPPEVWINCRCRPQVSVTAAADAPPEPERGIAVVARPRASGGLAIEGGLPPEELHVTLGYFGRTGTFTNEDDLRQRLTQWVQTERVEPGTTATVGGVARMGNDDPQAVTLLLESPELGRLRSSLEAVQDPDRTHPHFVPHMTVGYGVEPPRDVPREIPLDRLELWWGPERIGADMSNTGYTNPHAHDMTAAYGKDWCPPGKHKMPDGSCMDDDEMSAAISEEPWSNFSASDYSIEQWRRATLIHMPDCDPDSKSCHKLPVRTPSGTVNRAGVHAAAAALAGARGGVNAPASEKAKARRALRGLYKQIGDEPPDSLRSDGALVAVDTHDAPGWVTHPRETQRLRTYWTRGAGAAKIRWGAPGDFDRCRKQLAKYVGPPHLEGTCANLHYVALGFWPGQPPHGRKRRGRIGGLEDLPLDLDTPPVREIYDAFAASSEPEEEMDESLPPMAWFEDPHLQRPTPLTVTADGQVFGHLATWGTCHVGIEDRCTEAPRSAHNYAYFRTGEMVTAGGTVPVGQITMDTGHAGKTEGPQATVAHYDDTGTVVADVAAGEDDHGIWVAGMVRPGVTGEQLRALRAGALSGDWRRIGGNLELVAALVVNVPGFPVPRAELAASADGRDLALIAAAVVIPDPNVELSERIAIAVGEHLDARAAAAARKERASAILTEVLGDREERATRVAAEVAALEASLVG